VSRCRLAQLQPTGNLSALCDASARDPALRMRSLVSMLSQVYCVCSLAGSGQAFKLILYSRDGCHLCDGLKVGALQSGCMSLQYL